VRLGCSVVHIGRLGGDQRSIDVELTDPCCTTRRAKRLTVPGQGVFEEGGIVSKVAVPLRRHIVFIIDRLNRADWLAGSTIDTLVGMDVESTSPLIDAINRTLVDTRAILDVNTRLRNYISHQDSFRDKLEWLLFYPKSM